MILFFFCTKTKFTLKSIVRSLFFVYILNIFNLQVNAIEKQFISNERTQKKTHNVKQIVRAYREPEIEKNNSVESTISENNWTLEFKQQSPGTEGLFEAESIVREALQQQINNFPKTTLTPESQSKLSALERSIQKSDQAISELFTSVGLTDANVTKASPQTIDGKVNAKSWDIAISFDAAGAKKFAELTKYLAGTDRCIGIFLNNKLISCPVVSPEFASEGITGGKAVIKGNFDFNSAKQLADQIKPNTDLIQIHLKYQPPLE